MWLPEIWALISVTMWKGDICGNEDDNYSSLD